LPIIKLNHVASSVGLEETGRFRLGCDARFTVIVQRQQQQPDAAAAAASVGLLERGIRFVQC
jgi:hypothetical protein